MCNVVISAVGHPWISKAAAFDEGCLTSASHSAQLLIHLLCPRQVTESAKGFDHQRLLAVLRCCVMARPKLPLQTVISTVSPCWLRSFQRFNSGWNK